MAIRADRKNHFMTVEFAMQREMEYRKKLEIKGSDQSQLPQVSRPTTAVPRPTLNLNKNSSYVPEYPGSVPLSRPSSGPHPSTPQPRLSPSSGPSSSANKQKNNPVPLPEGIFTCKVCQLDCKTGFNLLSHYHGHKHKAKVQGITSKGKEVAAAMPVPIPKASDKRPYCHVCNIWCADEFTFRMHFSCTNHILRQYDWLLKKRMAL